jgi:nicotinate phosphoribosyltransferase
MSLDTLGIDVYQLTTLVAHADEGRLQHRLSMGFFFRKLPKARNYVVFCGLRSILQHAAQLGFDAADLETLAAHPALGPALAARPEVLAALRALDGFEGEIDALPEGTLAFAGPGLRTDGKPLVAAGVPLQLYTPLIQVKTDLPRAKLIETPWLARINHMSMVASKAARVADAAGGKAVLEFGQRRTHPHAAIDAAYAAYLAGCAGTSNLAAQRRFGIPASGTMDHFYVQGAEQRGRSVADSEREAFAAFARAFPSSSVLLVDTYDTERGIRHAVEATGGKLTGIRLDSNVNPTSVARARALLDELGAKHAHIFCSDGLDEYGVRGIAQLADGFGVGENITCSPDSATGVGAVGKVIVNGYGKATMKISKGSGKATLPGELQAHRYRDHDLIALAGEAVPSGGRALLEPVWRGRAPVRELPSLEASRAYVHEQLGSLPPAVRALEPSATPWPLVASDGLVAKIESLVKEAACA